MSRRNYSIGRTMIENERRIITLLAKNGPMSNKQLQQEGHMGWATVHKIVNRLCTRGIVRQAGVSLEPNRGRGKRAYLYDLSESFPLAIGVDFEHEATTVSITNVSGHCIATHRHQSPRHPDLEELEDFLVDIVTDILAVNNSVAEHIVGIGVGIPRLELLSRKTHNAISGPSVLRDRLASRVSRRVEVDGNVRVYALYERWKNGLTVDDDDFLLVSIRGGLGVAVCQDGKLLVGQPGYPGALAHVRVVESGRTCWCGRTGCVETVVSERYFHDQYMNRIARAPTDPTRQVPKTDIVACTHLLFQAALDGNADARSTLWSSARYLSLALAPVVTVTSVRNVIVSGHFGRGGALFTDFLRRETLERVLPELGVNFRYVPLDDQGFTVGAALLVLNDYLTGLVFRPNGVP